MAPGSILRAPFALSVIGGMLVSMPTAAFNADYWTAVAAIAPVLALTNTVTMTSAGRAYLERKAAEQEFELRGGQEARPINIYAWRRRRRMALVTYALQAIVTTIALLSLADRRALVWALLVTGLVVVSLVLIAAQAIRAGEDAVARWMANR
jgi:hypothetical protein